MKKQPHDVLVLNKAWAPLHIVDWKVAMSYMFQEKARPINHVDDVFITYNYEDWAKFSITQHDGVDFYKVYTSDYPIAIPEIMTLTKFDTLPKRHVKYSRQRIFTRDGHRCGYCGKKFKSGELTMDHIIPKCVGGKKTFDNIISSCLPCNQRKADRTPEQAGMTLKFKPHKPVWYSPLAGKTVDNVPCKSWQHFMQRVS